MSFQPLCSIVIPVYNGARYLREAVDSALAQSYPRVEILVVNDGSTDGGATEALARSYGERIVYLSKPNGGVASALNEGIRRMRGDYFSWLSHDDVYHPHKLARQVAQLGEAGREVILYSDVEIIDQESVWLARESFSRYAHTSMLAALVVAWPVNGCSVLVPRPCFSEAGLFDESLKTTQDYDLWFRFAQRYRFVHIPEPLVKSRVHPGQGSRTILVHAREMNELYSRALAMQTEESVLSLPGVTSLAHGYLEMARALTWRKRAFAASNSALLLALGQLRSESLLGKATRPLDALTTFGANLALELPVNALRRARRFLAMRRA